MDTMCKIHQEKWLLKKESVEEDHNIKPHLLQFTLVSVIS